MSDVREPTIGKYKRLLSLDGGGSRGFFTFYFLDQIRTHGITHLLSHVDLVAGTSVGAMVAAALGCGLMDNPEIRPRIEADAVHIFGTRNESGGLLAPVYTGLEKTQLLCRYFRDLQMKDSKCPLMIVSAYVDGHRRVFTSWNDPHVLIRDALDSSSAAPTYFPPIILHDPSLGQEAMFMDGGIVSNSPVDVAIRGCKELWPRTPYRLLSIGNRKFTHTMPPITNPDKMGAVAWFKMGLADMVINVNNISMMEFAELILGKDIILRVEGNIDPLFDEVSPAFQAHMQMEAQRAWQRHQISLLRFFRFEYDFSPLEMCMVTASREK